MSNMKNLKISEIEQFYDLSKLVELTGNASTHSGERFLIGFQVEMNVTVINKNGDKKDFHLVFQNEERNNQLQCYSNYGMASSAVYGCDADETPELEEWLSETKEYDFNESIVDRCVTDANELAKAEYLLMLMARSYKLLSGRI